MKWAMINFITAVLDLIPANLLSANTRAKLRRRKTSQSRIQKLGISQNYYDGLCYRTSDNELFSHVQYIAFKKLKSIMFVNAEFLSKFPGEKDFDLSRGLPAEFVEFANKISASIFRADYRSLMCSAEKFILGYDNIEDSATLQIIADMALKSKIVLEKWDEAMNYVKKSLEETSKVLSECKKIDEMILFSLKNQSTNLGLAST